MNRHLNITRCADQASLVEHLLGGAVMELKRFLALIGSGVKIWTSWTIMCD